jgi:hypothetical protein
MIPPFIPTTHDAIAFVLSVDRLVELFIFNGTVYFETVEKQRVYCQCLALCPKPRTTIQENAFENGWITVDGFVREPEHRFQLQICPARLILQPFDIRQTTP